MILTLGVAVMALVSLMSDSTGVLACRPSTAGWWLAALFVAWILELILLGRVVQRRHGGDPAMHVPAPGQDRRLEEMKANTRRCLDEDDRKMQELEAAEAKRNGK